MSVLYFLKTDSDGVKQVLIVHAFCVLVHVKF